MSKTTNNKKPVFDAFLPTVNTGHSTI